MSQEYVPDFEVLHIGINEPDGDAAEASARELAGLLGLGVKSGASSVFAGTLFEVMKGCGRGELGHVALGVSDVDAAAEYLRARGAAFADETASYGEDGKLKLIYLRDDYSGFALHLVKKPS